MLNFLKKQGEPVQKVEVKRVAGTNTPVFDEKKTTEGPTYPSWPYGPASAGYSAAEYARKEAQAQRRQAQAYYDALTRAQQAAQSLYNDVGKP